MNKYTVIDYISLSPHKCVIYPRFFRNYENGVNPYKHSETTTAQTPSTDRTAPGVKRPESNKHNFILSKTAAKTLQDRVAWLYYYAKKKTVVTRSGKTLTDLKLNFATLKLPSEQIHSSDFITKNCLNQLFIEISKKFNFKNYVWRLEYQKNGNLHYHFVTDTYIDYHFLNRTWARILNKYGYTDQYTRKFSSMSLAEYIKNQGGTEKIDFKTHQERYAKGCRNNWKEPNCVDVKAVFGKNNIGAYIAKYMAKNDHKNNEVNLPSCEQNSQNSRLWFCSRSLSQCTQVRDAREALEMDFFGILKTHDNVRTFVHDYCTVLYYKISDLTAIASKVFSTLFEEHRKELGYEPA